MPEHKRLIVRPGAIGDVILALPAMEHLRADYLEIWVPSQAVLLVRFADRVQSIAKTGLDMLEFDPPPALVPHLQSFDSIVSWYATNRTEFRTLVTGLGLPVEFLPAMPPNEPIVHAADFYLAQVGGSPPAIPRIECPRGAGDFAVLHPFAGADSKRWPLERFHELKRMLERQMPVHWCAGPEDALEDAVRIDDLYELAQWLASARLFIGNDSGITHLAAAVGTPVVAIFGPTDPRVWAPRGPKVSVVTQPELGQVTVDAVLEAVQRLLRQGRILL